MLEDAFRLKRFKLQLQPAKFKEHENVLSTILDQGLGVKHEMEHHHRVKIAKY